MYHIRSIFTSPISVDGVSLLKHNTCTLEEMKNTFPMRYRHVHVKEPKAATTKNDTLCHVPRACVSKYGVDVALNKLHVDVDMFLPKCHPTFETEN